MYSRTGSTVRPVGRVFLETGNPPILIICGRRLVLQRERIFKNEPLFQEDYFILLYQNGGVTGNRTPIIGETVRYNSLYTITPYAPFGATQIKILLISFYGITVFWTTTSSLNPKSVYGSENRLAAICLLNSLMLTLPFIYVKEVISHKATYLQAFR